MRGTSGPLFSTRVTTLAKRSPDPGPQVSASVLNGPDVQRAGATSTVNMSKEASSTDGAAKPADDKDVEIKAKAELKVRTHAGSWNYHDDDCMCAMGGLHCNRDAYIWSCCGATRKDAPPCGR